MPSDEITYWENNVSSVEKEVSGNHKSTFQLQVIQPVSFFCAVVVVCFLWEDVYLHASYAQKYFTKLSEYLKVVMSL